MDKRARAGEGGLSFTPPVHPPTSLLIVHETKILPSNAISPQLSLPEMRTPDFSASQNNVTAAPDSHRRNSSLENLLAHLDSSKQALEHEVQQLLQENILSKSAKKDNHWQAERARILSDLNAANMSNIKKEDQIHELEKELGVVKVTLQHVQRQCEEAEQAVDKGAIERADLLAEIEHHRLAIQDLEKNCKSKQDLLEQQQQRLAELEYQFEELETNYSSAAQELNEKTEQIISMRDAYEKVHAAHAQMQIQGMQELQQVCHSLEVCRSKCEQQEVILKEREIEHATFGTQVKKLEARCLSAEVDANVKAALLSQTQSELDTLAAGTISLEAQVDDCKAEAAVLKTTLTVVEKALAHERSLKAEVDSTLAEYKHREKHLLQVDKSHRNLQQDVKWRNEQFQSLEEAHAKLHRKFQEAHCHWESDKKGMFKEIDLLQDNLRSKERLAQESRTQLHMLHQALAHEESRRKLLALQSTQAQFGMENVAVEFEAAQSAIETLRASTTKEIASLRETLSAKNIQIKEMQLKQAQIEQECDELKRIEIEFQTYKRNREELQQALQDEQICLHKKANGFSVERMKGKKQLLSQEEMDSLLKSLAAAEASIGSKDAQLIELEIELDRGKASIEDLELKLLKLEKELERVLLLLDDAENHRAKAEGKTTNLEFPLAPASLLIGDGKTDRSSFQSEGLQQLTDSNKLETKAYSDLLAQESSEKPSRHEKKEKPLQQVEEQIVEKEINLKKVHNLDKHKSLTLNLESCTSASKAPLLVQSLRAQEANKKLVAERLEIEKLKKRAHVLDRSLTAEVATRDVSIGQLRGDLHELKALYRGVAEAANVQTLKIASMEERLQDQQESQDTMEERLHAVTGELNETAEIVEKATHGINCLHAELRNVQEEAELTKGESVKRLETLEKMVPILNEELKEVTQQLEDMISERDMLLQDLHAKELDILELKKDNEKLTMVRDLLEDAGRDLHERELQLIREVESNSTTVQKLGASLEVAEESLASAYAELNDLHSKLRHAEKSCAQLQINEEAVQELKEKLSKAEANVHEIEEKLTASEWTVQQLGSEISKLKLCLGQKEREAALLQNQFSDLVNQQKRKESEMLQMQCDFEKALKTNQTKEAELCTLTCRVQDMDNERAEWKTLEAEQTRELNVIRVSLAETKAALTATESAVERGIELHRATEGALEILKLQLTDEEKRNAACQCEMESLHENLKRITEEASIQLEELKEKQQQLEQSQDHCHKASFAVTHLKTELLSMQTRLESSERKMEKAAADLVQYKENCSDLLDLIEKKDLALKDIEAELELVQLEAINTLQKVTFAAEDVSEMKKLKLESCIIELEAEVEEQKVQATVNANTWKLEREQLQDSNKSLQAMVRTLQAELKGWKEKAESLADKNTDAVLLQSELVVWKQRAHEGRALILELQQSIQEVEAVMLEWKENIASIADEGRKMREEMDLLWKDLNHELEATKAEVAAWEERSALVAEEAIFFNADLESSTKELKAEVEVWKGRAVSAEAEGKAKQEQLEHSIEDLQSELEIWKGNANVASCEGQMMMQRVSALECSLQALQKHVEAREAEVMEWKERAKAAEQETTVVKGELNERIRNLQAELEGWKNRGAMAAGQCLVLRKKNEDAAKQVKVLQAELLDWKKLAAEAQEESRFVKSEHSTLESWVKVLQSEDKTLRTELVHWKEKAISQKLELESCIKSLRGELERWKQRAQEAVGMKDHLEDAIQALQVEVDRWKLKATSAEEEGESVKLDLLDTLEKLEGQLDMWSDEEMFTQMEGGGNKGDLAVPLNAVQWGEEDIASAIVKKCTMVECDSLTRDLEAELGEWKERALFAEEKERCLRKQFNSRVKNLQMEVEAWQKSAACIAEDGRIVQLGLEKRLKDLQDESLQVKNTAITQGGLMAKEFEAAMVEMQAELDASNRQVADAAADGELLRTAFDDAMKAVEKESVAWEEKLAIANKQLRSVKAQLTDCMQALQSEVVMCRERIESIIEEGISERQELHDKINDLQMELLEWKERAQEAELPECQLKDSLTQSQAEAQEWRERSVVITQETLSLQTELQSTMEIMIELRSQLDTYKENKYSQEKLTEQLQRNLLLVNEEAHVRKEKLLQVLSDLENTQAHKKELQQKLHLVHQHLLEDERCTYNMSTMEKEVAVMAVNHGSEMKSPPEMGSELSNVSVEISAVDQQRLEFPWLPSSESSKQEHGSRVDAEGNQATAVAGDDEMTCKAAGKFGSIGEQRHYLELCTSLSRNNKDHQLKQSKGTEVCGPVQKEKAFFQVLEENPTQNWYQKRSAKSGVLEEVDGNLPHVSSNERFPSADEHFCTPLLISNQSQAPQSLRHPFNTAS